MEEALAALGHQPTIVPCTLDLAELLHRLRSLGAEAVFNLVEDLEGTGRLIHLVPFCLEAAGIPYTGAPSEAMLLTSNKTLAKSLMAGAGIPTPQWVGPWPRGFRTAPCSGNRSGDWLVKSVWEHASVGLDESGLLRGLTPDRVAAELPPRAPRLGGACFAERFVDGREFNISLLAGPLGPEVLPFAEMVFEGFGPDRPRIVGYRAKWDEASFEYQNTVRRFEFGAEDGELLERLRRLALRAWDLFGLAGYARVDFRIDGNGRPWVLEVNANPCLSPDAGFAAALERAGITFDTATARVLDCALRRTPLAHMDEPGEKRPSTCRTDGGAADGIRLRYELVPEDGERVGLLTAATGFFHPPEVEIAVELVEERLARGPSSGYEFVMAEEDGRLAGYTCFGPIPCTASSYDLYWIAVHPDLQGRGLGRRLMEESERLVAAAGGTRLYLDTSHRAQYVSTRAFYERCGFRLETVLEDFYAPGDGKAIYGKALEPAVKS